MKRVFKYLMFLIIMIIPIFLNAETFGQSEQKARDLFSRSEFVGTYDKYLNTVSSSSNAELISLEEYKLSMKKGKTYLFDGTEYYTRTKQDNNVYIIRVQSNKEISSGNENYTSLNGTEDSFSRYKTRAVVNVKPTTRVVAGSGTYKDPYVFSSMFKVNAEVNNNKYGEIADTESKFVRAMCRDEDCTYRVGFTIKGSYAYLDNDCDAKVYVGTRLGDNYTSFDVYDGYTLLNKVTSTDSDYGRIKGYFDESKVKDKTGSKFGIVEIQHVQRNTTCHVYLGTGFYEIKVPGATPNTIYLRYAENYYTDTNKTQVITALDTVPSSPGYQFKGYKYKEVDVVDQSKKLIPESKSRITEDATLELVTEANKYTIEYDYSDGSSPIQTEVSYDTNIDVPNPTRNGYSFTGWDITGMDDSIHIIGNTSITSTTLTGTKATSFKNLRLNSGVVKFKANWIDNIKPAVSITTYNYNSSATNKLGSTLIKSRESYTNDSTYVVSNNWLNRGVTFVVESTDSGSGIKSIVWRYNSTGQSGDTGDEYPGEKVYDSPFDTLYPTFTGLGYRKGKWIVTDNNDNVTTINIVVKIGNARIDFDANGGTVSGTNPSYVKYDNSDIYSGRFVSTTSSMPTASKNGWVFDGWYTAATGGTKVVASDETIQSNVSGWTNSSGKWIVTNAENVSGSNKLYAHYDGDTFVASFDKNGATSIGSNSLSCKVTSGSSCEVTAPSITRSGFTIDGWSTNKNAESGTAVNGKITLSSNQTYYALTHKLITVTFYRNNNTSLTPSGGSASTATSLPQDCKIRNLATECSITSPTINPPSGFSVLGYSTTADDHTSSWAHNNNKSFSANAEYYAQTKKDAKTITITFNKKGATSQTPSGGSASTATSLPQSCNISEVYNGAAQNSSCNITSPKITVPTGYTAKGYNTNASATTSTWDQNVTKSKSASETFNAIVLANTYKVTYNSNGGSGTMASSDATYNANFVTRPNTYTKSGATFNGWNEAADGSGTPWKLTSAGVYENGNGANPWKWTYTKSITLYAQWVVSTPPGKLVTIGGDRKYWAQMAGSTHFDDIANANLYDNLGTVHNKAYILSIDGNKVTGWVYVQGSINNPNGSALDMSLNAYYRTNSASRIKGHFETATYNGGLWVKLQWFDKHCEFICGVNNTTCYKSSPGQYQENCGYGYWPGWSYN